LGLKTQLSLKLPQGCFAVNPDVLKLTALL